MGAVLSSGTEPLLAMELMDHGSLFDLLHNDSMVVEGDIVLQILRDVAGPGTTLLARCHSSSCAWRPQGPKYIGG